MTDAAPAWLYTVVRGVGTMRVVTRDKRRSVATDALPTDWRGWLAAVFGAYLRPPFADYHAEFWEWVWSLQAETAARPFVAIWPRGFGKSSSAEVAVAALAARDDRKYVMYISGTQSQSDDHVKNTSKLLLSDDFARHYPRVGRKGMTQYNYNEGWRRDRIVTASDFVVDSLGLDTASRGVKWGQRRPDLFVIDDVDDPLDSPGMVAKKVTMLTQSLLPAGAPHATTLVIQNLVHEDGIVSQLADGRADFLADRIVSGPHPALTDAAIEQDETGRYVIKDGHPTWAGMDIPKLQAILDTIGYSAFLVELQHMVQHAIGGIFGRLTFRRCAWAEVPPLDRIVVWVDPAVTDTDKSDAHGIQADGIARDGTIYRLWSWENRTSPEDAMRRAILKAVELKAECVGVETDQGGDTWKSAYAAAWLALVNDPDVPQITAAMRKPTFKQDKAGAGHGPKAHRASLMLADYERGQIVHALGTHETLERALKRYLVRKPYDLVDSSYYSWHDLRHPKRAPVVAPVVMPHVSTWNHG